MREIKFRAWDTQEKRMIEQGLFIECNGLVFHDEGDMGYLLKEIAKKDKYVVMQFTGLKDKNGKEIYEGDIVKLPDSKGCIHKPLKIKWKNDRWIGKGELDYDFHKNWEVIGNIYENPELIEVKK